MLKDVNGDISDHLRNHIHLTNCIHLKNHMHKHSPMLADRSLMRDLIVLQRSRSLRDPSASPPSWHSPSVADLLTELGGKDIIQEGRRSVGIERPRRQGRRLSGSSPQFAGLRTSKVDPGEDNERDDVAPVVSEQGSKSELRDSRRIRRQHIRKSSKEDFFGGNEDPILGMGGNESLRDIFSGKSDSRERKYREKGKHVQDSQVKSLSEQLNDAGIDSDDLASSNIHRQGRSSRTEQFIREPEDGARKYCSTSNRVKRRKFRGAKRSRAAVASRDTVVHNEMSVASNSLAHDSVRPTRHMEEEEEDYGGQNVTRAPRNGCGIPWNWSRIHDRGRTFLDMAGRSLSCGLPDRKGSPASRRRGLANIPVDLESASSSTKSNAEALPLLIGSQDSTENFDKGHDYSGELGIFADHLLKHDVDSDLASEARSGNRNRPRRQQHRHQNLTQKYMPQAFRDLVGQNLVVQALSNAVNRRKIGLLYVFYGPHGTGKTSCARIFARALNCQSSEYPKPCGYCGSCIAHDMGKSRNIREVSPVSNFDFESIMDLLDSMSVSKLPSAYRVFIFDDCDTLSSDCWSAISKVIDRAPRRLVFILVCSSLDVLPHVIISRCQKFFFPKIKDADIIYTLQWISSKEDLEIDTDALKLIASRSDGSLRDALMTLEQLSLLGQRISVTLVQELVGLICDEKLVDLLDLALSADTVNTIKNLRVIMETGVEPLALMSQLATVITDILAGSYDWTKERHRRKFFRRQPLTKEDMEKLRQALKTLSEAEKQLRMSNDKLTWLTAALLQLAPDQQYLLPNSSAETSFNHSPLPANNIGFRETVGQAGEHAVMHTNKRGLSANDRMQMANIGSSSRIHNSNESKGFKVDMAGQNRFGLAPQHASSQADGVSTSGRPVIGKTYKSVQDIWMEVLERIQSASIREFLYHEGKLVSVSFGAAPTVQLMFSSHLTKNTAEKFGRHILQAFETTLASPVTIEIRCEPNKDTAIGVNAPLSLPAPTNGSSQIRDATGISGQPHLEVGKSEIVELEASSRELKQTEHINNNVKFDPRGLEVASDMNLPLSVPERVKSSERNPSRSIVRGKVSLAHVIQQAEGCSQHSGWSRRKAVSIAEKLEQENLRLEPRSRNLLCWKTSRATRKKLSRLKIRTKRPHALLKFVTCGRCLSSKSSR